jgi:thiamine pyrophosphokinase
MRSPETAYIVLNGILAEPTGPLSPPGDGVLVVAVDGGALSCRRLGWSIHVHLGDMDSLTAEELARTKKENPRARSLLYKTDKDETDFELAMALVLEQYPGIQRLEIFAGLGGRWDMTLANILTPLARENLNIYLKNRQRRKADYYPPLCVFRDGDWSMSLLVGPAVLSLDPDPQVRRVSLLPLSPRAGYIRLEGPFRYPLDGGDLLFGLTRGLSNELGREGGSVFVDEGLLLVTASPMESPGSG